MDWNTFVISILGSGVVAATVTALVNHYTQIRAIKESGLYTKRADVLDEMMKRMERLHRIFGELVSFLQNDGSEQAEKERQQKASKAFNYFSSHYQRNRHYLPKKLSDKIGNLSDEYKKLFVDFIYDVRIPGKNTNIKLWRELGDKYQVNLVKKKEEVADEFRKMIGVK